VTSNGLEFQAVSGTFNESGSVYTSSQAVQVGFTPAAGQQFMPLITLQPASGVVTVNLSTLTVTSGQVSSAAGLALLGSLSNASIAALTSGNGLTGLTGTSFNVAGVGFVPSSLVLTNTGGIPQVQMHGSLSLPYGLGVNVSGSTYVAIGSNSAPTLTSFTATASGPIAVAGVSLASSTLNVAYTASTNTFVVSGNASAAIGDFKNFNVQLGGRYQGQTSQGW
jgi:hypothetical protein